MENKLSEGKKKNQKGEMKKSTCVNVREEELKERV